MEGYINGLLTGICKKWYRNKQLMEMRNYSKGQKNGVQIAYWENGNKRFEFIAQHDAYEGELKEWNYNGKLFHLAHFVNGQEDGEQKLWYDNGKIRANYVIISGKRYGLLGTKNCKNASDSIFVVK
jgi:antitoxin component YwqK of YwqJK toxin-antitoxin module